MELSLCSCVIVICQLINLVVCNNVILPTFSWDPRNECFNNSAGKGRYRDSKGYYAHLEVDLNSQIYFICPSAVITYNVLHNYVSKSNMFENMHMCTEEEFRSCQLGNKTTDHTRLVMNCDTPLDTALLKYRHFSFGRFKKSVDGFAFDPKETYYFIATSNGTKESLLNRKEGRCHTHNMRLAITICEYGQNCHDRNQKCDNAVAEEPANNSPSVSNPVGSKSQPTVEKKQKNYLPQAAASPESENDGEDVETKKQKSKSPDEEDNIWENKTFMLYVIVAAICGFFLGLFLTSCICMLLRKSRQGSSPLNCFKIKRFTISEESEVMQVS